MSDRFWRVFALGCALSMVTACADDTSEEEEPSACSAGEVLDPISGRCLRGTPAGGDAGGGGVGVDAGVDAGSGDTGGGGGGCVDTVLYADRDGDGAGDSDATTQRCVVAGERVDGFAREGGDCDDEDPRASPGQIEACDEADNNCDGALNEGLTCAFYAHTDRGLYIIDPFEKVATDLGATPVTLFDMDTHPDGTLYGAGEGALYKLPPGGSWTRVGSLGSIGTPNGMAISSTGDAYATGGADLYTIDVTTGATMELGRNAAGASSSGDCVLDKGDTLFMSATPGGFGGGPDRLVRIDRSTRAVSEIGSIGVDDVYGLTAAWGRLFGLTGAGQLIEIDKNTGAGVVLHTFPGLTWYGAASTPAR